MMYVCSQLIYKLVDTENEFSHFTMTSSHTKMYRQASQAEAVVYTPPRSHRILTHEPCWARYGSPAVVQQHHFGEWRLTAKGTILCKKLFLSPALAIPCRPAAYLHCRLAFHMHAKTIILCKYTFWSG